MRCGRPHTVRPTFGAPSALRSSATVARGRFLAPPKRYVSVAESMRLCSGGCSLPEEHHIHGMLSTVSGVRTRTSTLFRRKPTGWSLVALIDPSDTGSHGSGVWFSERHKPLQHYLIVAHARKGLELPDILSDSGEEVLPVFSSEEAAQEFLSLSSLGKRWCIRGFSGGELVSVLFAFHARINGVLLDPHPGSLAGDVSVPLVGRDAYMSSLLETGSHHPAV